MKTSYCAGASRFLSIIGISITILFTAGESHAVQPPNSLSVVSYGATPNDATDDRAAIQSCITAAESQGKGVWFPAGVFRIHSAIYATGITITGEGMNSTTIYRQDSSSTDTQIFITAGTVRDLYVDGNGTARGVNADTGFNINGVGWLIERVKIHHSDAGMWATGEAGTVRDCVLVDTFADGVNINNGDGPLGLGKNLTIQNCTQTGSGDDGFAINSQYVPGRTNMQNPKIIGCVSSNSTGANGIRIAGGTNSTVQNCLVVNPLSESGMVVGKYGAAGYDCVNAMVSGNTIVGCGTISGSAGILLLDAGTSATFSGNYIKDSRFHGFSVGNNMYSVPPNFTFGPNNIIDHPTLSAVYVSANVSGAGTVTNNTVRNLNAGQVAFRNDSSSAYPVTLVGNSWQGGAGASGVTFYQNASYAGTAAPNLPIGSYTQDALAARGIPNDWASSVRVPAGYSVTFFADWNFTGSSWTRTADTANLGTLSPNANDQMSSCQVTAPGGVTFYANTSYGGTASIVLPVGDYTQQQLAALGIANDWASSVRVPSGRSVTIYSASNFTGSSWTRTSDTPNFSTLSPNANDQMSSCRVQ